MPIIVNGTIITGDGKTIIDKSNIYIHNSIITEITQDFHFHNEEIIDAEGKIIIPGIINHHVHGCTFGPLFSSGAKPLHEKQVKLNLDKHLLQGTTTILNMDGFASFTDVEMIKRIHPINIKTATCHTSSAFKAAELIDGKGLTEDHKNLTIKDMINKGAIAIGEIGGGHTLGGVGQEYLYIPQKIMEVTGVRIAPAQAHLLKEAVLDKQLNIKNHNLTNVKNVLKDMGLQNVLSAEKVKEIIINSVLPSVKYVIKSIFETVEYGKNYNLPVILHNAAPSVNNILNISNYYKNIIAAHSNHSSFEISEAMEKIKQLKNRNVIIDIATLNYFGHDEIRKSSNHFTDFFNQESLIDVVSTDYAGGRWDPILTALESVVKNKQISLQKAIQKVTSNVTKIIPGLAPNRGLIKSGKIADILLINGYKISEVDTVIIDGKTIVSKGKLKEHT